MCAYLCVTYLDTNGSFAHNHVIIVTFTVISYWGDHASNIVLYCLVEPLLMHD